MGILSTLGMPIAAQLLAELWVGALRPFSAMRAYYDIIGPLAGCSLAGSHARASRARLLVANDMRARAAECNDT